MTESPITRAARIIRTYDAQGDHRTGTEVDRASAEWLADEVRRCGAEPLLEPFDLQRIEPHTCYLECDERRTDGLPAFDCAFTDARGIDGTLGPLGSDAAIAFLETTPNGEYSPAFRTALDGSAHRAFVVVTRSGLPGLAPVNAPRFATPHNRPVLLISSTEAEWLNQQAERQTRVRIVAEAERVPTAAHNVTARIAGTDAGAAPVVVMTPRSGWWNCASERGGGIVCWLETLCAAVATPPLRTMLFTANSGHELGHLGLRDFQRRRPELRDSAPTWLHFGANLGARGSDLVIQCSSDDLRALAEEALASQGARAERVIEPGQQPSGEARNIYDAGGRYLSLLGRPGPVFHHPADRWPAWVGIHQVAALAAAVADIAMHLAAG